MDSSCSSESVRNKRQEEKKLVKALKGQAVKASERCNLKFRHK